MEPIGMTAIADGSVRRCQPFDRDNTCPSCETNRGPRGLGRFGSLTWGQYPHKAGASDGQFITRKCRNCATTWRELVNGETA